MTYVGDSFFTLSQSGQIGLAILSGMLALGTLRVAYLLMWGFGMPMRLGIGVFVFALFVWLSPQVYYTYYRIIIDGLPAQWVIDWPPFAEMIGYASFTNGHSLSAHSQGLLFWSLVVLALRASTRRGPLG